MKDGSRKQIRRRKKGGLIAVETHCHTQQSSLRCGKVDARSVVRDYAAAGYRQLITTDHYYARLWEREELAGKTWEERIEVFCAGYEAARDEGKKCGVNVLFAAEIQFDGTAPYDFLVYGMDKRFLLAHPYLNRMRPEQFYALARRKGFLVIHAHPFRKSGQPYLPICYDGMEVYNGHPRHDSHNALAARFAAEHGLILWSGTDYHQRQDCGRGGLLCPRRANTMKRFLRSVRRGETELILTYESEKEGL